ncbi:3-dehydroquinate synthase [Labrys wisconsinensis]|uniref:3-dehydroquinate synthase n=1 Tax=Labrys wisconsinensis TaxID=425677 RepID=A0ABU0JLC0_9HYPH|nr:3-dehydroquinate synthase [Labrys wisconsinensis]MDQ0474163.1 3-dehydroquinate synthase [Labrys wisconsinensis]
MTEPTIVPVALGERSYDIAIGPGLLAGAGARVAALAPGARVAVVTDETVARLHLPTLAAGLEAAGLKHAAVTVRPGEGSKNYATFARVCDELIAAKIERGDIVLAFGGGVVGDLAGFAAAVVRRGMRFVQVPTTLLAQVDSSVGGKTGINSPHGKNLVGAFHQPSLVIADTAVLDTLSPREFRAGYAEVAKYGLIDDEPFFHWLERSWREVLAGGAARQTAIARSCRSKAAIVARDETETGDRALLNLGHTFGHALEAVTRYDGNRLVHGEGVAIGMVLAHEFSARQGLCPQEEPSRVAAHLAAVGLPTRLGEVPGGVGTADELMAAITQDKKVRRGQLTFILTRGIGRSFIARDVDPEAVRRFLAEKLAEA